MLIVRLISSFFSSTIWDTVTKEGNDRLMDDFSPFSLSLSFLSLSSPSLSLSPAYITWIEWKTHCVKIAKEKRGVRQKGWILTVHHVISLSLSHLSSLPLTNRLPRPAGDLECFGRENVSTPHVNSLATDGLKLTQFLSAASVCSTSLIPHALSQCPFSPAIPLSLSLCLWL
jgi:hypothetical protein